MSDPVIQMVPPAQTTGAAVTLDVSTFDKKLAGTDNLVQELAEKFDEHAHAYSEITSNTHSHDMSALTNFLAPDDNLTDLGSALKRWKDIYAGNAVIQTSDRNYKQNIEAMGNPWDYLGPLSPVTFQYKGGKRIHTCFIAQDVKAAMGERDWAIFCEQDGVCGLRYEEAIAPIVACIKDLSDTMDCAFSEFGKIKTRNEANKVEIALHINRQVLDLQTQINDLSIVGSERVELETSERRACVDALVARITELENNKPVPVAPSKLPLILGVAGFVMGLAGLVLHFM